MGIDRSNWKKVVADRFYPNEPAIYVGDGWKELVCNLVDALDETGVEYRFKSIMETFGALCVYADVDEHPSLEHVLLCKDFKTEKERFWDLIHDAEARSVIVCETCGNLGSMQAISHLIRTLCVACSKVERERHLQGNRELKK
jgi:hypothetical protein